jgi:Holliday junction resolvase RusA-like endonuclease
MNTTIAQTVRGAGDAEPVNPVSADPIVIEIIGRPVPKGRPRIWQGKAVTPVETRRYEATVQASAKITMNGRPPLAGALQAGVMAYVPVPESWSKKKTAAALAGDIRPTPRPDLDNYVKAALDGMNGIAFQDDAQIVEFGRTAKFYSDRPRLVVTLRQIA